MQPVDPPQVTFGPFRLDRRNRRLYRGAAVVPCRPKSFAVLEHLALHPGRLVTKDELLSTVWPRTAISDTVLKVCVREIREALGDDTEAPRFIETAHRLGYRFIGHASRASLPAVLSTLVGRGREIEDVARALQRHRLVTLVGSGGVGKSRLALEAATAIADQFDDGAWWIDLAPLESDRFVAPAVAGVLGVRDQPGYPLTGLLSKFLESRSLLLVVDNCEHVIAACSSLLQRLLRSAPRLRVLATSREPLDLEGEQVWPTLPLSVPASDDTPALASDAVRLFVERATSALPSFELSERNAAATIEIVRRLDGLPLAIELAAARVRSLPVDRIAARLRESFGILSSERRGEQPRHQTLRAAFDWSYDLLPAPERQLLRRLSVFAGTFSAESAERVAHDPNPDVDATEAIGRLVDKSLVFVADREDERSWRYRMLETVRQHADERLRAEDDAARVRQRYLEHFVELAEAMEPKINGAARQTTLRELEREHANFRVALEMALTTGDCESGRRLAAALFWFWFHRGFWREGRTFLAAALGGEPAVTPVSVRALLADGVLAWAEGDHSTAAARLTACIEHGRPLAPPPTIVHALHFLAMARVSQGAAAAGRPLAEEAVALARTGDDRFALTCALASHGVLLLVAGHYDAAERALEESVEQGRRTDDAWATALPLRNLAIVASRRGEYARARTLLEESLRGLRPLGEKWFVSRSIETLAEVIAWQGDHTRAARLFGAAEGLREAVGAPVLPFYRVDYDRAIAEVSRQLGGAALEAAWRAGRSLELDDIIADALQESIY